MIKKDLLYTKDYAWVKIDGEIATIGISEPGARMVEEFVFIDLPEKGRNVKKGEDFIHLEAMKWTGTIKSPFNGEVIDVNNEAVNDPSIINKDPYNTWLVKIKLLNPEEAKDLLTPEQAEQVYKR